MLRIRLLNSIDTLLGRSSTSHSSPHSDKYGVKSIGRLMGAIHSSIGQEAVAMGVCANLKLDDYGIEIDELTDEQKKYLASWEEGT